MRNKFIKIFAFSLLLTNIFVFAHSELDLFSPENHLHDSHDFCDLIIKAKPEDVFPDFEKLMHVDFYTINTFQLYNNNDFNYSLNININLAFQKEIPDYIINNSLLI